MPNKRWTEFGTLRLRIVTIAFVVAASFLIRSEPAAATPLNLAARIDFDDAGDGAIFGREFGQRPGDEILRQDGIRVTLEPFRLGEYQAFHRAMVYGGIEEGFTSPRMSLNNINLAFHFDGLPFEATLVTFDFVESGGMTNFAVNGHAILELSSLQSLPLSPSPGVLAIVAEGIVALSGPIDSIEIGGQELALDNLTVLGTAVPEPSVLSLVFLGMVFVRRRRTNRRPMNTGQDAAGSCETTEEAVVG